MSAPGALSPTSSGQKELLLAQLQHAERAGLRLSELSSRSGVDGATAQRLALVLYKSKKLR